LLPLFEKTYKSAYIYKWSAHGNADSTADIDKISDAKVPIFEKLVDLQSNIV
jgi:hypothetical protein